MRTIGGLAGFAGVPTGRIGFCTGIAGGGVTGRCGGIGFCGGAVIGRGACIGGIVLGGVTIGLGACAACGGVYPGRCCCVSPVITHSRPTSSYLTGALAFKITCAWPVPSVSTIDPCAIPRVSFAMRACSSNDRASEAALLPRLLSADGSKIVRVNPRAAEDPGPVPSAPAPERAAAVPPVALEPPNHLAVPELRPLDPFAAAPDAIP